MVSDPAAERLFAQHAGGERQNGVRRIPLRRILPTLVSLVVCMATSALDPHSM